MTTYYESADGVTITRSRAMHELRTHSTSADDYNLFDSEMGVRDTYDAQAVLAWLGY